MAQKGPAHHRSSIYIWEVWTGDKAHYVSNSARHSITYASQTNNQRQPFRVPLLHSQAGLSQPRSAVRECWVPALLGGGGVGTRVEEGWVEDDRLAPSHLSVAMPVRR